MKRDALCCAADIRTANGCIIIIDIIDIDRIIENPIAVA